MKFVTVQGRVLSVILLVACVFGTDLLAGEIKVTASSPAGDDEFGHSAAVSGNYAIVGNYLDNNAKGGDAGSVEFYVFTGTTWSREAVLTANDGAAGDWLGHAVAISGTTAVAGAPRADGTVGAAYVFERSGGTWTQVAKLSPSDGATADLFGWTVAISGDYVVVGSPRHDTGGNIDAGAAYIYFRNAGGVNSWGEQAKLIAPNGAFDDRFGEAVAISGDYALIGSPQADSSGKAVAGAAYVFLRSGTTWSLQQKLVPGDPPQDRVFGFAVSISGSRALIGAPEDNSSQGAAYVFTRSGTTWSQQQKLTAGDGVSGDRFGYAVSIHDTNLVVGAPFDDAEKGSFYPFVLSGGTWTQFAKRQASDGAAGDRFGLAVSIQGTTVVAGAPNDTVSGLANAGSAYFYHTVNDLALPVALISFTATPGDGIVKLHWVTASEWNNLGFIVERAMDPEGPYLEIGSYLSHEGLVGQGNSTVTTEYNFVDRAVTNGVTYYYRLADRDFTGRIYYHDPISATPNAAGVEIQRSEPVTSHFQLFPNYPNPFNPETTIRFELPVLSDGLNRIRLSVYNIAGQLVRTLYEGELAGGVYEMKWDGTSDLGVRQPSGIYFLYLQAGTLVQTRRMVLLQ